MVLGKLDIYTQKNATESSPYPKIKIQDYKTPGRKHGKCSLMLAVMRIFGYLTKGIGNKSEKRHRGTTSNQKPLPQQCKQPTKE
jgi:hypothetical protein